MEIQAQFLTKVKPRGGGSPGKVVGQRRCQLEGCRGQRLIVKWSGGMKTMPCTKGMAWNSDKKIWEII